jgi:hypothetical protein
VFVVMYICYVYFLLDTRLRAMEPAGHSLLLNNFLIKISLIVSGI